MSYFAPFLDETGLNIPLYQDIEDYLTQQAKVIFGNDIYLANDSQDFQLIATFAKLLYDTQQSSQLAYNSRSPLTAIGTGLDAVVAINGILRSGDTLSTAPVDLTGDPFTIISNGTVGDTSGNLWNLPVSVTLDSGGGASVTATCTTPGSINAAIGTINTIQTPTQGWASITNPVAATPGQMVETDSDLRTEQASSVANPSQALTTGILGSVLEVPNVTQAVLYENDTNINQSTINGSFNPGNFPPHSITLVVTGGDGQTIANTVATRKTPGCYTNGDQSYTTVDTYNSPTTIRFYLPTSKTIDVTITIKALSGYTSAIGDKVKNNIVDYLNSLIIGQTVIISEIWQAALDVHSGGKYPFFSLTSLVADIHGGSLGTTDIAMNFNWLPSSALGNITLVVT